MSSLIFLLCLYSTIALSEVVSIDIITANYERAHTANAIQITLWFNYTIYQHTLSPTKINHTYTVDALTTLGPSDCHKSPLNAPEAKMMIENDNGDAIVIDSIAFLTASGTWYGIRGRCIDSALLNTQDWLYHEKWEGLYTTDEVSCASGKVNAWFCIDNHATDCRPAKQMLYFDTTRANEFINNAEWSDATNVIPEIVSCDPTTHPSFSPAIFLSNNPTTASDTIYNVYSTQSQLGSHDSKPFDIKVLLLALIAFLCILIAIVPLLCMWMFVKHKKRVSAEQQQHMCGDDATNVENRPSLQMMDMKDDYEGRHRGQEFVMSNEGIAATNGVEPDEFIVKGDDEEPETTTTKY